MKVTVLKDWDKLPDFMRTEAVRPYWEILWKRRRQLRLKRCFDVVVSFVMLVILFIPMFIISIAVKLDTKGPVLYRQIRITQYGRKFKINKFRTMYVRGNCRSSSSVTVANDKRVTKVGAVLRKYRLDEFPQLINVLTGDMSFVGTRPEVPKYVDRYLPKYHATLLLPAGITSECSIRYKDENRLLDEASDVDRVYVEEVLPGKMKYNLQGVKKFSFIGEIVIMFRTVFTMLGKEYN